MKNNPCDPVKSDLIKIHHDVIFDLLTNLAFFTKDNISIPMCSGVFPILYSYYTADYIR